MIGPKTYLGDGVYAEFDGFGFVLTTSDGLRETNRIVLEPEVLKAFQEFSINTMKSIQRMKKESK